MDRFPQTFRVRQQLSGPRVEDIEAVVAAELTRVGLQEKVQPGQTVAITAGSRGIAQIARILAAIVRHLKRLDARPLIVPAMGSHGGATAEGQQRLLESYGITEGNCGCPIRSSMETVVLGQAPQGFDIHFDRQAHQADHVLVCGRVKPHTGLSGQVQSGLLKMLLIGLGKHAGALNYHWAAEDHGFDSIGHSVVEVVIQRGKVVAGLAIVENARDEPAMIEAVAPRDFVARDHQLLQLAEQLMPRLPFDRADVLIIDEIGKDISGTGMDTNVVGRKFNDHRAVEGEVPRIKRILIRSLTPATQGNALGIGMCEFCLERVIDQMDRDKTAVNGLTSLHVSGAMIPLSYPQDRDMLAAALSTIGLTRPEDARLMWIRNTLQVSELECSAAYLDQARDRTDLTVLTGLRPLPLCVTGSCPTLSMEIVMRTVDEAHEIDDRFPTGEWMGFYVEPHSRQRRVMDLFLQFARDRISGQGDDPVGKFTISGTYHTRTAKCAWTKQYVGQHCVEYTGQARDCGIIGTWRIPGQPDFWSGPFFIWPQALGDLDSAFEKAFVEYELTSPFLGSPTEPLTV